MILYTIASSLIFASVFISVDIWREKRRNRELQKTVDVLVKQANIIHQISFMIENFDHVDTLPYSKPLSKSEMEFNKKIMFQYLEKQPDSKFWENHPEYVDMYLEQIDISEIIKRT